MEDLLLTEEYEGKVEKIMISIIRVDIRTADAIMALCNYCERMEAKSEDIPLRALLSVYCVAANWIVSPNVDGGKLVNNMVQTIIKASQSLSETIQEKIITFIMEALTGWVVLVDNGTPDASHARVCIAAAMEGMFSQATTLKTLQRKAFLEKSCTLLDGSSLDLRLLLSDAPVDFRLEEVVREHFAPTLFLFLSIKAIVPIDCKVEFCEKFLTICVDYFRCLSAYLVNSVSSEPFLCSLSEVLIDIYIRLGLMETEVESILAILQSFRYFKCFGNFAALFRPVCHGLVASAQKRPELAYQHSAAIKAVLYSVSIKGECSDYPDPIQAMKDGGSMLGELLKALLPVDRVFCESFASNLMIEFPNSSRRTVDQNESSMICKLAVISGNIAITVKDDTISRICLSSLLTQFNKTCPSETHTRDHFLAQFSLLASNCASGIFNTVLDTLTGLMKAGTHPVQTLTCLANLAQLVSNDPIKRDVLLVTLMRSFVDKAVSLIAEPERSKKTDLEAPDLDFLLRAICMSVESFPGLELTRKTTYVDLYQEFWMVLVALGYQQELKWRDEWTDYIPIIARGTPVLIKERDRLQSPGSTFSQVVLTQTINPSLRQHLGSFFLPNSAAVQLRNITFAQCLWLIAIYHVEINKLRAGYFEHVGSYLQSDVLELLGISPLVEDLISTIISRWRIEMEGTFGGASRLVELARLLMGHLCHIQARTHRIALRLLKQHFLSDFSVYADVKVWDAIASRIGTMFMVCRAELGSPALDNVLEELTRDPTAAQSAFCDLIDLCRQVYGRAAQETPNYFFKFAHSKIYSTGSETGDRDVALLELLRLVFPSDRLDDNAQVYLTADSLLFRNAENFVHHEMQSLPVGENVSAQVLDLLTDLVNPNRVRKGIRHWLVFTDRNPTITIRLLSALTIRLPNCIRLLAPIELDPLRAKLTATPSKSVTREMEADSITGVAVLLGFLSEQLRYDSVRCPGTVSIYLILVKNLLDSLSIPWPRFVGLRIILFTFEVLGMGSQQETLTCQMVIEALYRAMIRLSTALPPFMESPHSCSSEELIIIRELIGLLGIESQKERDTVGRRRRGLLASAFLVLLQSQFQETLVWLGVDSRGKILSPPDSKKDIISGVAEISLDLARRLFEQYKSIDPSLPTWKSRSRDLCSSSALTTFTIKYQVGLPTEYDAWIFSEPLLLPSAIGLFRKAGGGPLELNLAMRSLEQTPADILYFYIPQLVQLLRRDTFGFIERSILHIAKESALFAHQIIWNMQANTYVDEAGTQPDPIKDQLDELVGRITKQFSQESSLFYSREFNFFEKVTNISGALKPYVKREKWEKKAKIDEELGKIIVDAGVYLPSNPEYVVVDIDYDSGRPLQSHAKAPFMATFKVRPASGGEGPASWQPAIFKVGDDCRQDVLALQLISLAKKLFERHQLPVYLFPYRVVATAPGCGVIEVIPKSISRDQLGREKINSLYEYFVFRFGGESSRAFHDARVNFVRSMAAYSVICYLLAIKDRHNGNIMIDDAGHIIHIDFGFILDIAPGGITFENAPFKLTSEMLQVMGGKEESPYFCWFRELCVQAFLILRGYSDAFVQLVEAMSESGLPGLRGDKTIRNLRARFRLDLDAIGARNYMFDLVYKSCENVRTAMYDRYQLSKNGIPY